MSRLRFIVPVMFIAFSLAGCKERTDAPPQTATVKKGPLTMWVDVRGELEAEKSVKVLCPKLYMGKDWRGRGGSLKIVKLIPEGADVKKGALLVELDKTDLKDGLKQSESDVREKTADLEKARKTLLVEREKLRADMQKLRADLQIKELEKGLTEALPLTSDVVSAETELETAKVVAKVEQQDYEPMQGLYKSGHVTLQDLEIAELDMKQAGINLERKEIIHDLIMKGADECEKKRVALNVKLSEILLAQAQNKLAYGTKKLEEDILAAEADLEQAKFELKRRTEALQDADLKAPCDGTVVYARVFQSSGEEKVAEGAAVWTYSPIVHLPDMRAMVAKVHIEEPQIRFIKSGLRAGVNLDAIKDAQFHGQVTEIGNVAMDKSETRGHVSWLYGASESVGIRVFEVKVRMDEHDKRIRPGLNGDVKITVEEMKDVLSIPVEAVFRRAGVQVAYVKEGRRFAARPIETGKTAEGKVVVTKGLREGEEVSLVEPEGAR
jgi:multidrug efflux pump subunit AcrA (membrane-fusion protein)